VHEYRLTVIMISKSSPVALMLRVVFVSPIAMSFFIVQQTNIQFLC